MTEEKSEAVTPSAMPAALANQDKMRSLINSIDIETLKKMKIMQAMENQKKADSLPMLRPEVKWAQNPEALSLSISLSQIIRPDVKINGDTLEFTASGIGASGERRNYEFEINFFDHVDRGFMVRMQPTAVQLIVKKDRESCYMWKQLTRDKKPQFLKIDTERWIDPEDIKFRTPEEIEALRLQNMSEREKAIEERYKQVMFAEESKFQAAEASQELTKKAYLFAYSLVMFLGYFFILSRLFYSVITMQEEFFSRAYLPTAQCINALHVLAFFEAVHCYFGFTGGKVPMVLLQCIGRALICLYLHHHQRAQTSTFIFVLFVAWSLGEVLRYPYYMSTIIRKRMPRLEWIRYTAFIVLYPIGCIGELGVISATIAAITEPIIEILEAEGSGEGSGAGEPETIIHIQEIGQFYYFLKAHMCILPIAVLFLMIAMFKKRSSALATGAKIDARINQVKSENDTKMQELEKKFISQQVTQMKSTGDKKDE